MSTTPPLDKKRRWTDNLDASSGGSDAAQPSRPPLKKRFTTNGSISLNAESSSKAAGTSEAPAEEEDNAFLDHARVSKEALLRHMRKAKEESLKYEKLATSAEQSRNAAEARIRVLRAQLSMLRLDCLYTAKMFLDLDGDEYPLELPNESDDKLDKMQNETKALASRLVDTVQTWDSRAKHAQRIFEENKDRSALEDWMRDETLDLQSSIHRNEKLTTYMRNELDFLLEYVERLNNDIKSTEERLEQAQNAMDECMEKLMQAERRYDRAESMASASLAGGDMTGFQSASRSQSPAASKSADSEKKPGKDSNESEMLAEQAAKAQLAEHQLIVEARKKELEDLKEERQSLADNLDRLRSEFSNLSEERIMTAEYFKLLQLSLELYKCRSHYFGAKKMQLEGEYDTLLTEKRNMLDEAKAEKATQIAAMEAEINRLESDVARIQKQRDEFQETVNTQTTKRKREKELHEESTLSAKNRQERISELEAQLSDLRNDLENNKCNLAGPLAQKVSELKELDSKLRDIKAAIEILDKESNLQSSAQKAYESQKQLDSWTKQSGQPESDIRKNIQSLMAKADEHASEFAKLSLMIQFYEQNENQLLQQIDRVTAIYAKLDSQGSKLESEIARKKEQKSRLQAEKAKFAQTFAALKAARDKQMTNVDTLRRTSEQQLGHIKQLEEREKNLETQLADRENEVRETTKAVEQRREDVCDLQYQCSEMRVELDSSEAYILHLQKTLDEKTQALDEEKHLRQGVEDEYAKMQKTWDQITQGENPAEERLAEECEELRTLLKCSACRTRFRKRLLARCMHTFCKECIEACLNTRQRRCPTCGESFGTSDVKPFFL